LHMERVGGSWQYSLAESAAGLVVDRCDGARAAAWVEGVVVVPGVAVGEPVIK
jgi:hypothetical protein